MIAGIGIDLVEVQRIRAVVLRHGDRFLRKVFTPDEIAYSGARARRFEHLAARFAAKEAVLKAFGTGASGGVSLRDVEVVNNADGRPRIVLHGLAIQLAQERRMESIHLSLSHTETVAAAQVIIEGEV